MPRRLPLLFVAALSCGPTSACRSHESPTAPTSLAIAGNYRLLLTASPPTSCKQPNGAEVRFELLGVAVSQNGDEINATGRGLISSVEFSGTLTGSTLAFSVSAQEINNAFAGTTRLAGMGSAIVDSVKIAGTFADEIVNTNVAFQPVTTACRASEHMLLLTRVE
jgi:hypothetical protein